MEFIVVGLRNGLPVLVYLDSLGICDFTEGAPHWAGVLKRMWAVDDRIVRMLTLEWNSCSCPCIGDFLAIPN